MDLIYLDNSATTPLLPEVWRAMQAYFLEAGNAASSHRVGRTARKALEDAREKIGWLLGAYADEVVFTSGATEANNLAIMGLAGDAPGALVSSPIEHPCVVEPLQALVQRGFQLHELAVGGDGVVDVPTEFPPATRLISVMLANHETGALQLVRELAGRRDPAIPFHCDAAAGAGKLPIDFHDLGITSLTISAHKFHGPQGIGALLVRRGAKLRPLLYGGHQQHGKRPGTEPVALAVGMAAALESAMIERGQRWDHVLRLRQHFLQTLRTKAAPIVVNGPMEANTLPHIANVSFPGCQADALLMALDLAGVACSTGSACSSGSLLPSPVLRAMHVPPEVLRSAMRFSISHLLSLEKLDEAAKRISKTVNDLRQKTQIA